MKYNVQEGVGGKWVDKKELHKAGAMKGMACKIVSETKPVTREYQGKPQTQDITRIRFDGYGEDAVNVALNKPTLNALVKAFGDESADWQGKPLTATTMQAIVSGKMGYALYLVPEGFEVTTDDGGYVVIVKSGEKADGRIDFDKLGEE